MRLQISRKQQAFIRAGADEVLFGGAAGGGKSYGQIIDALLYALRYPKSKQLILRRTFPELEKSIIRETVGLYPREIFLYNSSKHTGKFANGSLIDYGYCDRELDVIQYQGAEYDTIRFDELTHFTETMYTYLLSRLRGANSFPKQVKSSTNPGNVGHAWVKARFVDLGAPDRVHRVGSGSRIFIPSKIQDNRFLLQSDPDYVKRLENLDENKKRALLYGDWDIFEGQYFTEFRREIHVIEPFSIPNHWRRYFAMDYGLDMLAGYWIAVDTMGRAYVYKELYESGLIISEAAKRIRGMTNETIQAYIAPPDLWNRRQDTGRSVKDIFAEQGIYLVKAQNERVQGWLDLKEWLKPTIDETGETIANMRIFRNCIHLIESIPALQFDQKNPSDCATEPHEYTHGPDALRYFAAGRPLPTVIPPPRDGDAPPEYEEQVDTFLNFGG